MPEKPVFNLWSEPWIPVELPSTALTTLSLPEVLRQAHEIHAFYEPSPLVVVAIHRLLVAILQDMYRPQRPPDLVALWQNGRFHPEKIAAFGNQYADRFDLFSEDAPFLQTANLGLQPAKTDNAKPVGYLLQEQTAGTAVTHYNHAYDSSQTFCAHCAAKGLLLIPPFASSGGAGIKPSINGVPPIYVLPGGQTLFDSLAASLTTPAFWPTPSQSVRDEAWWQRPLPIQVNKSDELKRVGYLHSLLFPARRVRLHPHRLHTPCTRCGSQTIWGVSTMVYEMGESRPKNAAFWRDPFAAYRIPKSAKEAPLPIRPVTNRVLWREFAGLFLPDKADETSNLKAARPAILDQLEEVWRDNKSVLPFKDIPVRVVGLRTDMKMKIFEWEEAGFAVPPRLLTDVDSAHNIKLGIEFAVRSEGTLKSTFNQYFGGGGKSERYAALKQQMSQRYWQTLGEAFQTHILQYTAAADTETLFHRWLDIVLNTGRQVFQEIVLSLPATGDLPVPAKVKRYSNLNRTDIKMIRLREDAMDDCAKFLFGYRKKQYPKPQKQEVA
ncbi:MAG: type I-E CRISPR-associated protein Cse1/CasA [Ardenticatenaceae bacterium]|nr:type I-E CRISPR-associated protein Cse1/CasA [Ardenticatenaceae bacterium]